MMSEGDFIAPHLDSSHDAARLRYRSVNTLYYFSPDWTHEAGGHLRMWDRNVVESEVIPYAFNRLVLMSADHQSYHSVDPVGVDRMRCSIATIYYSKAPPGGRGYFHVTEFAAPPARAVRRAYNWLDGRSRRVLARMFNVGRGRGRTYR